MTSSSSATSQRVVCAAIRNSDGEVICSPRHWDKIMHGQVSEHGGDWRRAEQGFVDNKGNFLTRAQALAIAREANQIIRRCGGDEKELFSENLY